MDTEETWERIRRIAAETGVTPEQVLLEIAEKLPEPRRSQLLQVVIDRCEPVGEN